MNKLKQLTAMPPLLTRLASPSPKSTPSRSRWQSLCVCAAGSLQASQTTPSPLTTPSCSPMPVVGRCASTLRFVVEEGRMLRHIFQDNTVMGGVLVAATWLVCAWEGCGRLAESKSCLLEQPVCLLPKPVICFPEKLCCNLPKLLCTCKI